MIVAPQHRAVDDAVVCEQAAHVLATAAAEDVVAEETNCSLEMNMDRHKGRYFNPNGDRRPAFVNPDSLSLQETWFPFGSEHPPTPGVGDPYATPAARLRFEERNIYDYRPYGMWRHDPLGIMQEFRQECWDPENNSSVDPFNGWGGFGGFRDADPDWRSDPGSEGKYCLSWHSSRRSSSMARERALNYARDNGLKSLARDAFEVFSSIPTDATLEMDDEESSSPQGEQQDYLQEDLLALEEDGFGCVQPQRPQGVTKGGKPLLFRCGDESVSSRCGSSGRSSCSSISSVDECPPQSRVVSWTPDNSPLSSIHPLMESPVQRPGRKGCLRRSLYHQLYPDEYDEAADRRRLRSLRPHNEETK